MKSPAAKFSISLLGPFKAELDGEPVRSFRSTKVRALLSYLAVESQRPWTRSMLGDLLWPDLPDKEAQSNLRNAISNLRQVIGDQQKFSSPARFPGYTSIQSNYHHLARRKSIFGPGNNYQPGRGERSLQRQHRPPETSLGAIPR